MSLLTHLIRKNSIALKFLRGMGPRRNYLQKHGGKSARAAGNRNNGDTEELVEEGLIPELPVLYYQEGHGNNYADFKEKMSTHLGQKHGDIGLFIQSGELWTLEDVEEPDVEFGAENRRSVSDWAEYDHSRKRRVELMEKAVAAQTVMFSTIYGQLSKASLEKLREQDTWEDVYQGMDPLALWRLIQDTYPIAQAGNGFLVRVYAYTVYARLVQDEKESLSEYKRRFELAIEGFRANIQKYRASRLRSHILLKDCTVGVMTNGDAT